MTASVPSPGSSTIEPQLFYDTAEQRVSDFLRAVGEFDDAVGQNNSKAAAGALERMRRVAAVDSRFIVALADCESRVSVIKDLEPVPAPAPPPVAVKSAAAAILKTPPARTTQRPVPEIAVPKKAPPEPAKPAAPAPQIADVKTAHVSAYKWPFAAICAALVLVVAAAIGIQARKKGGEPNSEKVVLAPALATAVVAAESTELRSAPNTLGASIAVLQRGQAVNVIALPSTGADEYTKVQPTSGSTPAGFVRTASLAQWSGNASDADFALAKLFAPADLEAQRLRWAAFLRRFPASPQAAEAKLESARIEVALARSREAAASASTSGVPDAAKPQAPSVSPERILRGRVSSLWEAGEYRQAMRLVDQILATTPGHPEALSWKKKIRAAQDAEANAQ